MIIKRFDQYFIFLLLLIAFFSAYKLFFDTLQTGLKNNAPLIATITEQLNTVKLKRFGHMAWIDASLNDNLTYDDQIYTHEGSSTQLSLVDNSIIDLSEKTLFKIGKSDKNTEFYLEQGVIHTKFNAHLDKKITLHLKQKKLELNSSDAQVTVVQNQKQTKISVLRGSININDNGVVTTIGNNQFIKLNPINHNLEKGMDQITLLAPAPYQTEYCVLPKKISFSFRPIFDHTKNFILDVATDPEFNNIEQSLISTKQSISLSFAKEGTYYWRVRSKNTDDYTIWQFKLIEIKPPEILSPESNETYIFEKVGSNISNPIQILFRNAHEKAEIEFFTPDNKKIVQTVTQNLTEFNVNTLGEYAFRIRSLTTDGQKSAWGVLQKFKVTQSILPFAPQIFFPTNGHEFIFYNKEKMNIELRWKSPEETMTSYNLIMTNQKDQNEIENTVISQNYYRKKIETPGIYKWKVKMIDKWLRNGPYSSENEFKVTLTELNNTLPRDGVVLKLVRPDQKVNFEWEKSHIDDTSIFEVSNKQDFNQIIHEEKTNRNRVEVVFKEMGTYYWRIKKKEDTGNTTEYAEPIRVIIEPIAPPERPILPKFQEFKIQLKETSKNKSLLDFIIPSAHANDYYTRIEWPAKENIKNYKIEIYQDQAMSHLLISKTISSAYFDWDNPPVGTFYWRMAYVDYWDRASEFSELSTIQINMDNSLTISDEINLLTPTHQEEEIFEKNKNVLFSWDDVNNATGYELILSNDLEFKEIFFNKKIETNSIQINHSDLKKGQFFWRVIAYGPYSTNAISKRRSFRMLAPPPSSSKKPVKDIKALVNNKTPSNYLIAGYAYSKDSYEISSPSFKSNIDGNTSVSLFSNGKIILSENLCFGHILFFKKGKVYNTQTWQAIDFLPSANYTLASKFSIPLLLGIGLAVNQTGVYPYTRGSAKPEYQSKTFLSPFISLTHESFFSNNLSLDLKLLKAFTGTSFLMLGGQLNWYYSKVKIISTGLNYQSKSFDYETQKIDFSELRALLGLGFSI